MDIIEDCCEQIDSKIKELDCLIDTHRANESENEYNQTQAMIESMSTDKDKKLDRILDQQTYLKMIIETDGRIVSLNKQIAQDVMNIDDLRRSCADLEQKSIRARQELLEQQAKELERFQMQQLKSISDDFKRHQEILETRKKESLNIEKEIEKEESGRESYLISYAKDRDKTLEARKQLKHLGDVSNQATNKTSNEVNDPDFIELQSVDEYAPYGVAPNSRLSSRNPETTNKRGNSTRGRRARGSRGGRQS